MSSPLGFVSIPTGFAIDATGGFFGLLVLLAVVIGMIFLYKSFHIIMHIISVGIASGALPFVINFVYNMTTGAPLFDITAETIVNFMFLGLISFTLYKVVHVSIEILDHVIKFGAFPFKLLMPKKKKKSKNHNEK